MKYHYAAVLIIIATTFGACSGESLVNTPTPDTNLSEKIITNDLSYQITLSHAEIGFRNLKLISEGSDPKCEAGHDQELHLNKGEDLLGEDFEPLALGSFSISMVAYCQYELVIGPGEDDNNHALKSHEDHDHDASDENTGILTLFAIHHLSDTTSSLLNTKEAEDTAHATLHLEGTWSKNGGPETGFQIDTLKAMTVAGAFDQPLEFYEGETSISTTFGTKYDRLFDGVDFGVLDEEALVEKILHNLSEAVHQHVSIE